MLSHQKVSKYYMIFFLLYMSLLPASIVENSDILVEIYFIFLKTVLDQTFNTTFGPPKFGPTKFWESSYQVRQILAPFCTLVALILG